MTTLREIAEDRALRAPDSLAYLFLRDGETEEARLTYSELDRAVRARAAWLQSCAQPGERAVLAYSAGLDFIVSFLACVYARLIPVPVAVPGRGTLRDESARRLEAITAGCQPRLLLSAASAVPHLPAVGGKWVFPSDLSGWSADDFMPGPAERPDDVVFLQYTSGSTQTPRGVAVTHRALLAQLEYHRQRALETSSETILAGWLPHHHDFGLVGFHLSALYLGSPYIFMAPAAFLQRPSRWLEMISRYRATYSGGPNFAYDLCARSKSATQTTGLDLSCWNTASIAGEPASGFTLRRFSVGFAPHGFRQDAFLPAYGLAEAVLCVAANKGVTARAFDRAALTRKSAVPDRGGDAIELVSYGKPIPGSQVRIVDPDRKEQVPADRVGEIWVSGDGVARGYWQEPEQTRATFEARLEDGSGRQYLRTGDYGFVFDGELFVTGRMKDVIIVRGENHFSEDLEATIRNVDPLLRAGHSAVFQTSDDADAQLVAVYEIGRRAAGDDHRGLFARIAQAVSAAHGLRLDTIVSVRAKSIPRTTSGKVRRHECKEQFLASTLHAVSRWDAGAPCCGDDIEDRLLEILKTLLPGVSVGARDNIFSHGCDSLTVARYAAKIEESFHVAVTPQVLYEEPTVAALAERLRGMVAPDPVPPDRLDRLEGLMSSVLEELRLLRMAVDRKGDSPSQEGPADRELTPAQREIRLLAELHPELSPAFTRLAVLGLRGEPLDSDTASEIFRKIAARHDALRIVVKGNRQRVLPYIEPDIRRISIPGTADFPGWLREERQRPFELNRAPLWRAYVITAGREATSFLVLAAHAWIADAWSMNVIATEFFRGRAQIAEPAARQFGELCDSEAGRRQSPEFQTHQAYWMKRLGHEPPVLQFPSDEPLARAATYEASCFTSECGGELRKLVQEQGGRKSSTLFQTLLTSYFVLLHRYTGQDRVMIGVESSSRSEQSVVGCCDRLTPVLIDFAEPAVVEDVQKAVRTEAVAAIEHRDYTLSMLAEDLRMPIDAQHPIRIGATIGICTPSRSETCVPRFDLAAASITHHPFPLTLEIRDLGTSLRLEWIYQKSVFQPEGIECMARSYQQILEAAAEGRDLLEAGIPAEEEQQRIEGSRGESVDFQQRFESLAALSPDSTAAMAGDRSMTYGQLNALANRIAWRMAATGIQEPDAVVGILAPRGCDFLAALVGTLKAGLTCLPLHSGEPPLRIRQTIQLGRLRVLWFANELRDLAEALGRGVEGCRLLCLDDETSGREDNPPAASNSGGFLVDAADGNAGALALIGARSTWNQVDAKSRVLGLKPGDVVAQTADANAVDSLWQFLAPLLAGAAVCVIEAVSDPAITAAKLADHRVTILPAHPHVASGILEIANSDPARLRSLAVFRWLVASGNGLPADVCRRWIGMLPQSSILNQFSRPQCGGAITHHVVEWPPAPGEFHVPIGRAIPGVRIAILDRRRQAAPFGVPGELCAEVGNGGGLCRIGARTRLRLDGALEYLGESGRLWSVNGWQVDPVAVEVVMRTSPAVSDAAVTVQRGPRGGNALVAYVVLRQTPPTSAGILRAIVRNALPAAFVPSIVIFVKRLPRTAAGTIDWDALPQPESAGRLEVPTPPSNALEETICAIWREVLNVPSVGVHDDLFELGGTSLIAAQIATKIGDRYRIRMPATEIFRAPTVAGATAFLEGQLAAEKDPARESVSRLSA